MPIVARCARSVASGPRGNGAPPVDSLVPLPVTVTPAAGAGYHLTPDTKIYVGPQAGPVARIGGQLAWLLRRSTGYPLPVLPAPAGLLAANGFPRPEGAGFPRPEGAGSARPEGAGAHERVVGHKGSNPRDNPPAGSMPSIDGIALLLDGSSGGGGDGYRLDVSAAGVVVRAGTPAGLFHGVQTLRQLLPAAVESLTVAPGPWPVAGGHIEDGPRFAYRGAMLDVARHFFPVSDVKRYLDEIALYKMNYLHLHLTDDQGWRIAVPGWPRLTEVGGATQVGGGPGGYYTEDDYREIVAYAADRYITVVPEIDMPGHVNAAIVAYPELGCDGRPPAAYTGTDVGFSSLCVGREYTYEFVDRVLGSIAALTPGEFLHVGGDETYATTAGDYLSFMRRAQRIVAGHGKRVLAWHQLARAEPAEGVVLQFWGTSSADPAVAAAVRAGALLVLSPAHRIYLDQKYSLDTPLGLIWAGLIDVRQAYDWDPGRFLDGVGEQSVLGLEAPLWTETVRTMAEIEYLAFPRLAAVAELAWSPAAALNWVDFRDRLAQHGPRWSAMGIRFYPSPQVPWPTPPHATRTALG
jgi:hexosaminidase